MTTDRVEPSNWRVHGREVKQPGLRLAWLPLPPTLRPGRFSAPRGKRRTLRDKPRRLATSRLTSWAPRHTPSGPLARRRLAVRLKKLVALSVNGNAHNFRAKSMISCLTIRSCATKSVGLYSIVDQLIGPTWSCSSLRASDDECPHGRQVRGREGPLDQSRLLGDRDRAAALGRDAAECVVWTLKWRSRAPSSGTHGRIGRPLVCGQTLVLEEFVVGDGVRHGAAVSVPMGKSSRDHGGVS